MTGPAPREPAREPSDRAAAARPGGRTGRGEADLHVDWATLAGAVTDAAYRLDDETAGGFGLGIASAAAAGILDAGIRAVQQRRRSSHNAAPDVPLDADLFDDACLRDLLEFLRDARRGMLTVDEIVQEAIMWRQLVAAGWPAGARDAAAVTDAVDLLASAPGADPSPKPPQPVEPANNLERAMAAAARDDAARPALWRALYDGEIVLPVVAYELVRPEGANFQFLGLRIGDRPMVLGFATEERFDALLPPGSEVSRVVPLGRDLPKFWPEANWLTINPGYENQVTLSPWEIAGLPDGARAELPHPRAVDLHPPDEDDDRSALLADAVARLPEVASVCWARVRPAQGRSRHSWQDVLVVTAGGAGEAGGTEAAEAAAVQALSAALPPERFARATIIGRQMDLAHPFIEAAVAAGRQIGP